MRLADRIHLAFVSYALVAGALLAALLAGAFFVVEDAILDRVLSDAVTQIEMLPMPDTLLLPRGMTLYTDDVPEDYAELSVGRHEVAQYTHVAVLDHQGSRQRLYLVLDESAAQLDVLLSKILYSVLVVIVLAVIGSIAIAQLLSRRLSRPLGSLVTEIDNFDFNDPKLNPLPSTDEVGVLSERFSQLVGLLVEREQRERNFSRFASHELRSPITVLAGTVAIMQTEMQGNPRGVRALERADAAISRMSRLVETFLFLARSSGSVVLREVTAEEIIGEANRLLHARDELVAKPQLVAEAGGENSTYLTNMQFLSIVLEILIDNAMRHGAGDLRLSLRPSEILLSNTIGNRNSAGHGFGLEIAREVCTQLGIILEQSEVDDRFNVRIIFSSKHPSDQDA